MTNTNKNLLIGAGVILGLIVLFALPSIWHAIFPSAGYGMMMGGGYGRGMMNGGGFSPMHNGGMMSGYGLNLGYGLMWLVPLAALALAGLGIAALIKYLREPEQPKQIEE